MGLFGPPNIEKMKAKQDINGLVKALRYRKDISVILEAAKALGEVKDSRAFEPLIVMLKDEHQCVRRAAAEALGALGDERGVEPLIALLKDKDWPTRNAAVRGLGHISNQQAMDALIDALNDSRARDEALKVFTKIGTRAVEPLCRALPKGRSGVAEALDKLHWQPGNDIQGATYWVIKRNFDKCIEIGAPAVKPLITVLGCGNDEVEWAAMRALCKIGAPAIPTLLAALDDSPSKIRYYVAEILVKLYRDDTLNEADKSAILQQRGKIMEQSTHADYLPMSCGDKRCDLGEQSIDFPL